VTALPSIVRVMARLVALVYMTGLRRISTGPSASIVLAMFSMYMPMAVGDLTSMASLYVATFTSTEFVLGFGGLHLYGVVVSFVYAYCVVHAFLLSWRRVYVACLILAVLLPAL